LKEDGPLIDYFLEGLSKGLVQSIYCTGDVPTTIKELMKVASKLDNQWIKMQSLTEHY